MRQHAIPHNILDIEFKLFTKFTLKEFAYLAIGVGFGGVMIYLTVSKIIPGILGIPIFIVSSSIGVVLGLIPINEQDADIFIKNFIFAINNPTQRVWLNSQMKEQRNKPEVKPSKEGQIIHKDIKEEKKKIIGSDTHIIKEQPIEEEDTIFDKELEVDSIYLDPVPKTVPLDPTKLEINENNISKYQFDIKTKDSLPGNINFWLSTDTYDPIPNVITYLKSKDGKILYANKTGPNGYFLTNKVWEPNTYILEFEHPEYSFPKVTFKLPDKKNKAPIKINNI